MNISDWIDVAVVVIPMGIGAIAWLLRLEMRLKVLMTQHSECRAERDRKEEALLGAVQQSAIDIAVVKTDVRLIKEVLLNGKRPPIIQADE